MATRPGASDGDSLPPSYELRCALCCVRPCTYRLRAVWAVRCPTRPRVVTRFRSPRRPLLPARADRRAQVQPRAHPRWRTLFGVMQRAAVKHARGGGRERRARGRRQRHLHGRTERTRRGGRATRITRDIAGVERRIKVHATRAETRQGTRLRADSGTAGFRSCGRLFHLACE